MSYWKRFIAGLVLNFLGILKKTNFRRIYVRIESSEDENENHKSCSLVEEQICLNNSSMMSLPANEEFNSCSVDDSVTIYSKAAESSWKTRNQKGNVSILGIVLAVMSGFFMACTSLFVKLADSLPYFEMMMARSVGTLIFGPPLMIFYFHPFVPPTKRDFFFILSRGAFGCAAMVAMFFAFEHIPLADATTIVFTSPVWTSIFGYFLLKEGWSVFDSIATLLCVVGVSLITRPSFLFHSHVNQAINPSSQRLAYFLAFFASISLALSYICVRKVKKTGSFTVVFYYGVVGIVLSFGIGFIVKGLTFPQCGTPDKYYALLCAFLSFCGQICVIFALKREKAAIVALGRATDIAFVFILQALFVRSTAVTWTSIMGALLILLCNVSIFLKKRLADGRNFTYRNLLKCINGITCRKH